jgi:hypothetical protein
MQLAPRLARDAHERGITHTEATMSQAIATTDHDEIRRWVESRKGHPAMVKSTHHNGREGGLLRIDFDPPQDSLERVDWEEFFATFDDSELAFLYQPEGNSHFVKFVSRDTVEVSSGDSAGRKPGGGKTSGGKSAGGNSKGATRH